MQISYVKVKNWRNFPTAEAQLGTVTYIIGANAVGKSNFLEVFRFLRDIAKPEGGGLQKAMTDRGGMSKVRCLHARKDTEVFVEIHWVEDVEDEQPSWVYRLGVKLEGFGANRPRVSLEEVLRYTKGRLRPVVTRPTSEDKKDPELLTQTFLEQIQTNRDFRVIAENLSATTYLHLVPQLLKFGDQIGGNRLESDPFGQAFMERVAKTNEKTRQSRLTRIRTALAKAVPQFEDIKFERDAANGKPHLVAKYAHHRPLAGWQREDQLSDGTLRLIALFWLLMEGEGLLLLEEPELSLDEEVVRNLPRLIDSVGRSNKRRPRQIFITTHSQALLGNKAIDGRWVLRIERAREGSRVVPPTEEDIQIMRDGFAPGDILLPRAHPAEARKMALA